MDHTIMTKYEAWRRRAVYDEDVVRELQDMAGDDQRIEDAFYRSLAFGTG